MNTGGSQAFLRKLNRKLHRHYHKLTKETGASCSNHPTRHLALCNTGQVNGITEDELYENYKNYGQIDRILLVPGKSCSFISFTSVESAEGALNATNGVLKIAQDNKPVYLAFVNELPPVADEKIYDRLPPGLELIENYVTESEEAALLNLCQFSPEAGGEMKHRQVRHYGYEFRYDTNNVDKDKPLSEPIPAECDFLLAHLPARWRHFRPDQLTVNRYRPGQGIPSHVDTHSAFEEPILSLSLGSGAVMEFRRGAETLAVFLPARSLLVMAGESRYEWAHGIPPKRHDCYYSATRCVSFARGVRQSFTFRRVRRGAAAGEGAAAALEAAHVHAVYEGIAAHFSETRHRPWPRVVAFLAALAPGGVVVDVGCGNGKYFGHNGDCFQIGADRSLSLNAVCASRGWETFTADCLHLPLRDGAADGAVSIAVIHHLATAERRLRAIAEILRVLRRGGRALIYVWAREQVRNSEKSTYIKQDRKNRKEGKSAKVETCNEVEVGGVRLPVHTNRTDFNHSDVLVPWKLRNGDKSEQAATFLRFYHVFNDGELDNLCASLSNCRVVESYYDQGNYCVVLEKK